MKTRIDGKDGVWLDENMMMYPAKDGERKRQWIVVVSIGFGGLISLVLLAVLLLWLPIWDIGPVDDADMFTEWHPIPENENALRLLEEDWPEWKRVQQETIDKWLVDPETHAEEIAAFFEGTEPHVERLAQILAVGAVQPGRVERYDDLIQMVPNAMDLSNTLYHRIILLDDPDERLNAIQQHHHLILMIGEYADTFIHALVTLAIEKRMFESIWPTLQDERISQSHLLALSKLLDIRVDMHQIFAEGFRSEYRVFRNTIEENFTFFDESDSFDWAGHFSTYGFLFHPNRSKQIFLEQMRQFISVLNQPNFIEEDLVPWFDPSGYFSKAIRPNVIGELFLMITLPSLEGPLRQVFVREAELEALRVVIALHQYRHEIGEWPERLSELVPTYLEAVPLDPFDGEPLRYLRDKRVIYSVGEDRVDQGGSRRSKSGVGEAKRLRDMEDLVFEF